MEGAPYRPLPQAKLKAGAAYHLPDPTQVPPVTADSPAVHVMTDLRRIAAVTITAGTLIDDANQTMINHGVRSLIVVDDHRRVIGIVTSTDILGEKPMQLTHERGIRHAEILVRDVMTHADRMQVIDLSAVLKARVGDMMATLKQSGRQHALAVEQVAGGRQMVCGIFSATQIARQLDIAPYPPETGRSFAEIGAAIGS